MKANNIAARILSRPIKENLLLIHSRIERRIQQLPFGWSWNTARYHNMRSTANTIRLIEQQGWAPDQMVDAGAHNSDWAYWLLKRWPQIDVTSFEPNRNCNPVGKVYRVGLSDECCTGTLVGHGMAAEVLRGPGPVNVVRLDTVIKVGGKAILKIDTQASTLRTLRGCGDLLPRFRVVHVEMWDEGAPEYMLHAIHDLLTTSGFNRFTVVDAAFQCGRCNHYDAAYYKEIQ